MKYRILAISLVVVLATALVALVPLSTAFAGQPNQSCQVSTVTPGQAASASGSAFNPNGTAGTVYAGQQPQNSNNANSVSQYDVACFEVTTH